MRKPLTVALLITPLLALSLAGVSQAQLVPYDNFKAKLIDPAKWTGSERNFGPAPNTEALRKITAGRLEIDLTTYGRTDSNSGTAGVSNFSLNVTDPVPITTMQSDVRIKSVGIVGCVANTTSTRSRAQIDGAFFNDGTSPGAGDRTGDILAEIQMERDSITGDLIEAFITRCTNATCTTHSTQASLPFITGWKKGKPDTLRLQWDKPNKRFIYTVNPAGSAETITLSYTVSDSDAPVQDFKHLSVANSAASCTTAPRASATMKAQFDNVMVNP